MIRTVVCVAAVSLAVFGVQSASAAPRVPTEIKILFTPAELAGSISDRAVHNRLAMAAQSACHSDMEDLETAEADQACEVAALADGINQFKALQASKLAMDANHSATYAAAETSDVATGPHQ